DRATEKNFAAIDGDARLGDCVLASAVSWRRRLRLVCTNERGRGDNRPAIFGAVKLQSAKPGAFATGCPERVGCQSGRGPWLDLREPQLQLRASERMALRSRESAGFVAAAAARQPEARSGSRRELPPHSPASRP